MPPNGYIFKMRQRVPEKPVDIKSNYSLKVGQTVALPNENLKFLRIGPFLDRGSFGVVHKAWNLLKNKPAIIKVEMSDIKIPQLKMESRIYM